jgi:ribulose-phosphate 3-epimerase
VGGTSTSGGSTGAGVGTTLARLRALCPTVSVGILPADLMNLGSELQMLERAGVGVVHVDVMDGCFCPQLTVGAPYVKGLRTPLLKDAHLMVREPLDKLADFVAAGADIITVHVEAAVHIHRVLQSLGGMEHSSGPGRGIVRGLALNPGTPLEWLTPALLDEVEMVSLLAVDPGWSGQRFAPSTLGRVARVKEIIASSGKDILVCVDGGITRDNIAEVAAAGVDLIAAGSAVFDGKGSEANARFVLEAVRRRTAG